MKFLFTFSGIILLVSSAFAANIDAVSWRTPSNDRLLVMRLDTGRIVIELAPQFAPNHVSNIKQLVSDGYFDDTAIIRSQDNYVVQWGDPLADSADAKSIGNAKANLSVEFFRSIEEIDFKNIDSRDAYADEVGFVDGFPVASDGQNAWLAHCYGMVGVSRGLEDNSGNGTGLYVVTGHAPRHLDRNVTLVGRVIDGMHLLSSLPRGTGALGFFENPEQTISIRTIRLADDLEYAAYAGQIMNTNSDAFVEHLAKRTTRLDPWFIESTGKIELCNVGVPSREQSNSDK